MAPETIGTVGTVPEIDGFWRELDGIKRRAEKAKRMDYEPEPAR